MAGCGGSGSTTTGTTAPTATLSASPTSITSGGSSTLTWKTTNATSVSINQGVGTVAASGTATVSPTVTATYTLTATGSGGTVTAVATVTVSATATPAPTATLSASPTSITTGGSSILTWTTTNATSVSINQGVGTVAASGTATVSPTATTTYTLTATGSGGTVTAVATVTVSATTTPAPTATLSASPTSIASGSSSTLTWTTTNATSVSINQGVGTVAASGSAMVSPTATTTYTLTATGSGGTVTAVATVTVSATTTPAPTVTFSASPTSITSGGSSTLTWTTTNATSVSIDEGVGTVAASGSTTVSPTATTQYTLTAVGSSTVTATATVTVPTVGSPNSQISHVIIMMMQNHTLDNLFATFPGANGFTTASPGYYEIDAAGNTVSPTLVPDVSPYETADLTHDEPSYSDSWDKGAMDKFADIEGDLAMEYYDNTFTGTATDGTSYGINTLWNYAEQYALADNFFSSAMNSEPAQELYMVAATVDSNRTASALPYYDPCSAAEQASDGGNIAVPLTETNVGDQLTAANVSWTWFQTNFINTTNGTCTDYVPQENPFQYFTTTQNSTHLQNFTMPAFETLLSAGSLASVTWITPDGAHDMHPGGGNILDGVEFIDQIAKAVMSSSEWQSTAIIVLFDEGGGWYDHVPPPQLPNTPFPPGSQGLGFRVPVIIISPYAKQGYISPVQMDFVSILRFIQWNWNLGQIPVAAQETREQQSGDLCDLLTSTCAAPAAP